MVDVQLSNKENEQLRTWAKEVGLQQKPGKDYSLKHLYTAVLIDFIEEVTKNKELDND